jgi:DNA (cytosine-5)-methyltransferase 1
LGLEKAGMTTVAYCEIDPLCRKVIAFQDPNKPIFEDIRSLSVSDIKERVDLICGGYPCTGHSVAGKKKGFKNEQSALWKEYVRIVTELMPKYCIIENSPNLRNTGLAELLQAFNEIGYDSEWSIISGYSVGAPHQRERIYIVFWRRDVSYCNPFRFWQADPEKEKTSCGWWSKRRIKRDALFKQAGKIKPRVLSFDDGLPKESLRLSEQKIKMIGNAVIPKILELIGQAIMDHERSNNEIKRI